MPQPLDRALVWFAVVFLIAAGVLGWRHRRAVARVGRTAAKWLFPTVAAAAAGALAAGLCEAVAMETWLARSAIAGFVGLTAWPMFTAISAVVRVVWLGWRPRELALVQADGSAPKLAGWTGAVVLSVAALGWAMFEATSLLSHYTAFKPTTLAFAEPAIAIVSAVVLMFTSLPLARGLTAIARTVDRAWRARGTSNRASLFTVRNIVVGTALALVSIAVATWKLVISPQLGSVDTSVLWPPAIGLAVLASVHAMALRTPPRTRRAGGAIVASLAAISIASALFTWRQYPSLTLGIWGESPIAGLTIDTLFDVDEIRSRVPAVEFRPTQRAGANHPDIVLVTIDTVRADHTPPYGGPADMPALRDLAARGVVFDWAFAPSNVTRRSIPSMITGLGPDRVRGRVVGWALRLDPRHVLLAERLAAGGYDTAGFMCCERFWGRSVHTGLERGLAHLEIESNGVTLAQRARTWLAQRDAAGSRAPLFVWMHILEPHNWTAGSGDPASRTERNKQYDRSLTAADAALGQLLGAFSRRTADNNPVVIVTADHGESLGDHGQPYHSTDLYNAQIRVPLVIAGPAIKPGRITQTVSLTDLMPSIVELAGFEPPADPSIDGRSFADLTIGQATPAPEGGSAFAAMIRDRSNPGGVTALIRGRWKLIESPTGFELYDIHADPAERRNASATNPREFDMLRRALAARQQAATRSPFE